MSLGARRLSNGSSSSSDRGEPYVDARSQEYDAALLALTTPDRFSNAKGKARAVDFGDSVPGHDDDDGDQFLYAGVDAVAPSDFLVHELSDLARPRTFRRGQLGINGHSESYDAQLKDVLGDESLPSIIEPDVQDEVLANGYSTGATGKHSSTSTGRPEVDVFRVSELYQLMSLSAKVTEGTHDFQLAERQDRISSSTELADTFSSG